MSARSGAVREPHDRPVLGLHGRSQLQEAGRACAFRIQRRSAEPAVTPDVAANVATFGDEKWWDAFQDDALHNLIRAAVEQNYDVRIAAARILEARARLGIVRADQWPGINAVASVTNERSPEVAGRPPVETSPAQITGSIAWELDFWASFDAPRSLLAPAFCPKSGRNVKSSVRSSATWRARISSCANRISNSRSRAGRSRPGETRCG